MFLPFPGQVIAHLEEGKDVRLGDWKAADIEILNTFQLLSAKPVIYLVWISSFCAPIVLVNSLPWETLKFKLSMVFSLDWRHIGFRKKILFMHAFLVEHVLHVLLWPITFLHALCSVSLYLYFCCRLYWSFYTVPVLVP